MIPWGAIGSAVAAFFRALLGIKPKDPQLAEANHALVESQEDARAFTAPDRGKSGTIDAFRLHRREAGRD